MKFSPEIILTTTSHPLTMMNKKGKYRGSLTLLSNYFFRTELSRLYLIDNQCFHFHLNDKIGFEKSKNSWQQLPRP